MKINDFKIGDEVVAIDCFRTKNTKKSSTIKGIVIAKNNNQLFVEVDTKIYGKYADSNIFPISLNQIKRGKVTVIKSVKPIVVKKNFIKKVTITNEVYVSQYESTWIDSLYTKYCKLLGRDIDKRVVVSEDIKEEDYDSKL